MTSAAVIGQPATYAPWEFMLRVDAVNYEPRQERMVAERTGHPLRNISSGVNFLGPPPPLLDAARQGVRAPAFRSLYDGPSGHLVSRTAIALYECAASERGLAIDDRHVVVTTGVSMALHVLGLYLSQAAPRASVLMPVPTFPLAGAAMATAGLRVDQVFHRGCGRMLPTPDELVEASSPDTRVLFLNLFNNPTGECYSEPEMRRILAWARDREVLVIVDKVSVDLVRPGTVPNVLDAAIAENALDRVVLVSSLAKDRALPGVRVGWIIASERLSAYLSRINGLACMSSVGAAAPVVFVDMLCRAAIRPGQGQEQPAHRHEPMAERFAAAAGEWRALAPGVVEFADRYRDGARLRRIVGAFQRWHHALLARLDGNLAALRRTFGDELELGAVRVGGFNVLVRVRRLARVDPCDFAVELFLRRGVQILPGPSFASAPGLWELRPGFWTRLSFAMDTDAFLEGVDHMIRFASEYRQ